MFFTRFEIPFVWQIFLRRSFGNSLDMLLGKLWLKFCDFWRSFGQVLDFSILLTKAVFGVRISLEVSAKVSQEVSPEISEKSEDF